MKSYKDRFYENLNEEIFEFREKTLSLPSKEVYDNATRITFYEFMDDYLRWENFKTEEYKMFLQSDKNFIHNLWRESLKWDEFDIGSVTDASCLVDTYLRDCLAEPVPHCM